MMLLTAHLEKRVPASPQGCDMETRVRERPLADPVRVYVNGEKKIKVILTCTYG